MKIRNRGFKRSDLSKYIYMFTLVMYLTVSILRTTMFETYFPEKLYPVVRMVMIGIILLKLIFLDAYSFKNIIYYTILGICIVFVYIFSTYNNIFDLFFLLLGAKKIEPNKIIKTYFIVALFLMIITFISSKIGIIENLQYYRPQNGKMREAFGTIYPTDFGAHVFYLVLSYCYIKRKSISLGNIIVFILMSLFLIEYCDARLDAICIMLACVLFVINRLNSKLYLSKISKYILRNSIIFAAIISIGITILYNMNPNNLTLLSLNKFLSDRLQLGSMAIDNYGFSIFGQHILTNGYGGSTDYLENYFFIDCSYLSIALRNGILFLTIILMCFKFLCKKNLEHGNTKLPIIIALISLNSMVAHHFLDLAYNPFLILIATPITDEIYENMKHKIKFDFSFRKVISQ